jgi:WXXGXW repeat (2 copies)
MAVPRLGIIPLYITVTAGTLAYFLVYATWPGFILTPGGDRWRRSAGLPRAAARRAARKRKSALRLHGNYACVTVVPPSYHRNTQARSSAWASPSQTEDISLRYSFIRHGEPKWKGEGMFSRRSLLKGILGTTAFAALAVTEPIDAGAQTRPPPPLRAERRPRARRGQVWVPGNWRWDSWRRTYVWAPGRWIPSRPGFHYRPPRWVLRHGRWTMIPGGWAR